MVGARVFPGHEAAGGRGLNAEIVGVGTELLLGQIANTNAQRISRALADAGINVYFHTVVGDNVERAAGTIRTALERSGAVVVTGGLGPTPDDITREAVAAALDVPLRRDDRLARLIAEVFERLGRDMPETNLRQADLPEGATAIDPEGTAPGFFVEGHGALLFALPGVPWEMDAMLEKVVLPELRRRAGAAAILTREVLVVGLGESATYQRIRDVVDTQSNPTVAFLSGHGVVRVRITARAAEAVEAADLVAPVETEVRARVGEAAIEGSHPTLAAAVADMLGTRGLTMAAAESLTGGLIGVEMTKTEGASAFFLGSLVTYAAASKNRLAGVDETVLRDAGPVSAEVAGQLARGARHAFDADLGVSATGVAGPEPHDGAPVGTIYVGAALADRVETRHVRGYGTRGSIQGLAVTAALDLGRRLLSGV